MTRPTGQGAADVALEIAPDVFCLGPWGLTQTVVYFVRSGSSWVLIDAGWASDTSRIERAAGSLFGGDSRPAAILLTHCHPDHAGSALPLARAWDCAVHMHPDELPIATGDFASMVATAGPLDRWVVLPLMRAMGKRRREARLCVAVGDPLAAIGSAAPSRPHVVLCGPAELNRVPATTDEDAG
jgi:glyoxylase-like metal-dependent hydrolase (beta-lactamase superfamily II)